MPFTTSHPAIVLPLKKIYPKYVSLSGLMAGAMSPDLLYFLNLTTVHRGFSHSWPGLVYFCIPAGVLFTIVFHYFIKRPLIYNLPAPLDRMFSGLAKTSFNLNSQRNLIILIISVTIGALSHLFWDSFTHPTGFLVRLMPFLAIKIKVGGELVHLTHILQVISTVVGGLFVIYFFWKGANLPHPDPNFISRNGKIKFWILGGVLSTLFALSVTYFTEKYIPHYMVSYTHNIGLAGWAGFTYYLIAWSVFSQKYRQN